MPSANPWHGEVGGRRQARGATRRFGDRPQRDACGVDEHLLGDRQADGPP